MATTIYWGVDSAAKVNANVAWEGKKHLTLYDYVVSKLKRTPDFWGGYVGGRYEITSEMIEYIFKRSEGQCRILIVYNGAHDSVHSVRGKYAEGARDAEKAIAAAVRVGVPPGVMIWGDVEGAWQPTVDWFQGWAETMYKSRYAGMGGIYCRPNIPQFYNPYTE